MLLAYEEINCCLYSKQVGYPVKCDKMHVIVTSVTVELAFSAHILHYHAGANAGYSLKYRRTHVRVINDCHPLWPNGWATSNEKEYFRLLTY